MLDIFWRKSITEVLPDALYARSRITRGACRAHITLRELPRVVPDRAMTQ